MSSFANDIFPQSFPFGCPNVLPPSSLFWIVFQLLLGGLFLPAMILLDSIVLIVFTVSVVILVLLPPLSGIVWWVVVLVVVAVLVVVVVLLLGVAVRLVLVVLTEALGK